MRVVAKVVAHSTSDKCLVIFRHVDSEAGIQVPAGTLELGESPDDGVSRETQEETGFDSLDVPRFLGTRDYDMLPYGRAELHRHYHYHLGSTSDAPPVWRHFESDPSGCPPKRIEFELYWGMLPDQVPELATAQDDFPTELGASLRLGQPSVHRQRLEP